MKERKSLTQLVWKGQVLREAVWSAVFKIIVGLCLRKRVPEGCSFQTAFKPNTPMVCTVNPVRNK